VTGTAEPLDGASIAGIGRHLSALEGGIRSGAQHSRRFSWYAWTFLFVVYVCLVLLSVIGFLFAVTTTTTSSNGSVSTTTTFPWWDPLVSAVPALVVLALAVREILRGRREQRGEAAPRRAGDSETTLQSSPSWTETVQQCQQMVTHAKNEVEWSFLPLVLGLFSLVELLSFGFQSTLSPNLGAAWVLVGPLTALPALALLWPLYRAARHWVVGYQSLLDRQVGELSRLEAEFFWRFTGTGAPG
jgi:hypothetical protein